MRRTILLLALVTIPINAFTTPSFIIQSNHHVVGGAEKRLQQQLYSTQQQQLTPNIENLPTDLPDSLSDAASIAANVRLLYCYIIIFIVCYGREYREGE